MSFLHSSYSSDTSSGTSIPTPAQDLSLHKVDGRRWSPERREGSDPSTVTQLLPPPQDQSIPDLADYDHQWDPNWLEGFEEQHLYIFK